jgi:rod shape-determining protein MreC
MLEVPPRHRPLLLLASILLLQILLLAFQIRRGNDVRLIRVWAVEILTPLQHAGEWLGGTLHSDWKDYVDLRHTRMDNQELRDEVAQLKLRNLRLESLAMEQERLERLLNFREAYPAAPMLAAEVIGANADASSQTLFLNRGQNDGIRPDLGVITPDGVVGKILEVYPNKAQVLLASDKESGVGALLGDSRTHGVVKGTGQALLTMDYVSNDEKVTPGEVVFTSGDDRIFPKDLPVGTVVSTRPGNPFQVITVRPAVRMDRLEEVLVLLSHEELQKTGAEAKEPPAAGAQQSPRNGKP